MCMRAMLEKVMNDICLLTRKLELIDTVSVSCQHCIIGVELTALRDQVFGLWLIDEQLPLGKPTFFGSPSFPLKCLVGHK